jgi:hypothetical protein
MLNVRVSPECESWLEAFAKGRCATKSDIARDAISAFQRSHQRPADKDQKDDDAMTPSQLARLSGILDREEPIVDELVWGDARRGFQRICFPGDFRRSQRETIRPALESFVANFHSLPKRAGWRVRTGDPCPPPQASHHALLGKVEYYSSLPIESFEPVEALYFSWSGDVLRHESYLDPQFSLRADSINQQFVPTVMRADGALINGQPIGLDELSKSRIHDFLVEAFDVIAKDLTTRLRGSSIDSETSLSGVG